MAYIFQTMARGAQKAIDGQHVKSAREWYYSTAKDMTRITPGRVLQSQDIATLRSITSRNIGSMCCYWYDPKLKDTLPYYDRFPLVFPTDMRAKGFLGINLHYLPPRERSQLMNALFTLTTSRQVDDKTRLGISYAILKSSSRMKLFKQCVKEYLHDHVVSEIKMISPRDWDKALLLPIQRFAKASAEEVWAR